MATLLTGSTGFLGSYLAVGLLQRGEPIAVLVRAKDDAEVEKRLWRAWQLHLEWDEFDEYRRNKLITFPGDLTAPKFGLSPDRYHQLIESTDSIIHCAAALNRRSERMCMNVNLRGTLAMAQLAREIADRRGLRRFSHVSTVSVSGERQDEVVTEDDAIDWNKRDYDAYGRTKKFSETMVRELLADVPKTIFRPSIVMGDSRIPETTQFDMVSAFSFLSKLPFLPLRPLDRVDAVPANWVADAVVTLHLREETKYDTYHLSAGEGANTYHQITERLAEAAGGRAPAYVPGLEKPFAWTAAAVGRFGPGKLGTAGRLIDVFFPYLTYNTVFDSSRVVEEIGRAPAPLAHYCVPLLDWVRSHGFRYPYRDWPAGEVAPAPPPESPQTLEDVAARVSHGNGNGNGHPATQSEVSP